jgi:glycine/D-amino acid oxidase-like deaminating enzyme
MVTMPGQVKVPGEKDTPFPRRPVVILGAGIIGCAAALQLLQNGFQVTLVGEYLPGDDSIFYASAWAGAAWHAAANIPDDQKYLQAVTHRRLLQIAEEGPSSGVCIVNSRECLDFAPGKNSSLWGKTVLKNVGPPQCNSDILHMKQCADVA